MNGLEVLFFIYLLLPFLAFLLLFIFHKQTEAFKSNLVSWFSKLSVFSFLGVMWGSVTGAIPPEYSLGSIYHLGDYSFQVVLLADYKALTLLALSTFLVWIVVHYCRYYLHRESGYARFFRNIFLFQLGIQWIAVAGHMDLFFAGWEILGISSFLLISFYRERENPVLNAFQIYVIYRICDLGILMGAWLEHHDYESFSSFLTIQGSSHPEHLGLLTFCLLLAAAGKSAQFPFSFWLPRAMEGPTPSSAIFYGALSVHAGVFLLLRTTSVWGSFLGGKIAVFTLGFISMAMGSLIAKNQSNIKGQIAYFSISQVGLMLMEIALGFETLALVHFVFHVLFRCYQLLISPSVVSDYIKLPVTDPHPIEARIFEHPVLKRLAVGEFFLEQLIAEGVVKPVKSLGAMLNRPIWILGVTFIAVSIFSQSFVVFGISAFVFSLVALSIQDRFVATVYSVIGLFILMMGLVVQGEWQALVVCALGIIPGLIFWWWGRTNRTANLLGWLILAGFPMSPFFVGEDLILHMGMRSGMGVGMVLALTSILNSIVFARNFVGRLLARHELVQ